MCAGTPTNHMLAKNWQDLMSMAMILVLLTKLCVCTNCECRMHKFLHSSCALCEGRFFSLRALLGLVYSCELGSPGDNW